MDWHEYKDDGDPEDIAAGKIEALGISPLEEDLDYLS